LNNRRVVITGLGVISSIGLNVEEFWDNALKAESVVKKIPEQWLNYSDYNSQIWSPLPVIDYASNEITRIEQKQLDPTSLMAIKSTFQALKNADLDYELFDRKRNIYDIKFNDNIKKGVFIGTGIGGISTVNQCFSNQILSGFDAKINEIISGNESKELSELKKIQENMIFPKRFNPFGVSMIMPNACSANLGIKFNINGPNNTFCSACASGTVAIGYGYEAVKSGKIDFAVTGGTEFMYDDYGALFYAFDVIKALTNDYSDFDKANRPFDKDRSGFLFSQGGCAVLLLEELENALKRDAKIIAEIIGFEEGCDAHNVMMIDDSGSQIKNMIDSLFNKASVNYSEIDYINTHGTGTLLNDDVESRIIDELFGKKPLINSTKSLLGHTLGASGAIEALVTALSIQKKTSHVCKNLDNPISDLNFITQTGSFQIKKALTQSFGFGGHNVGLLLSEY